MFCLDTLKEGMGVTHSKSDLAEITWLQKSFYLKDH